MPIEIRELVIRATVDPSSTGSGSGSCGTAGPASGGVGRSSGASSAGSGAACGAGADTELVQACVREVMRILDEKRER